jgi:hypothetical protein
MDDTYDYSDDDSGGDWGYDWDSESNYDYSDTDIGSDWGYSLYGTPGVDYDPEAAGFQKYTDTSDPKNPREVVISPDGSYYLNGKKVWSPPAPGKAPTASDWSSLITKLGNFATSPKGAAALAATAFSLGGANAPKTGGWKGSIPKLTAVREQVEMPAYEPYSGKAVMGGKFFTDPQYVGKTDTAGITAAQDAAKAEAARLKGINPTAPAAAVGTKFADNTLTKKQDMSGLRDIYLMPGMGMTASSPGEPLTAAQQSGIASAYSEKKAGPEYEVRDPSQFPNTGASKGIDLDMLNRAASDISKLYQKPDTAGSVQSDTEPRIEQPNVFTGGIPAELVVPAAQGGIMNLAKGRYLAGPTDGMADKIPSSIDGKQPAKLSHGEFVIPADVVSHLGNGNSDAGANQLYKMMDRVRKARTGSTKQGKKINPDRFTPGGIAGYASGGAVAFQAGGGTDTALSRAATANPNLGATQETNLAPWAGDYTADFLGRAQAIGNEGYKAFQGPLSAGTSPLQQQAFTSAGQINPQATFDTQLDEMRRQAEISRLNTAGRLTKAGAFGGGRQAIMESELLRNLGQQQALTTGKAYETAFDKAMGQYNTSRQQQLQDVGALAGLGAQQRQIEQQGIDQLRAEFEKQRQFPMEQVKFQRDMLAGLPVGSTTVTPNRSTISDLGLTASQVGQLSKWLEENVFKTPG